MASILDYKRDFCKYLKLRNRAESTIDIYTSILVQFIAHFKKDPHSITSDMIGDYILTLKSSKYKLQVWYTLFNFYQNIIKDSENRLLQVPKAHKEKFVPETMNHNEVVRLLLSIKNLKQRAALTLIYACALRISECVDLKIADIDGVRMQIHIKQSKGAKDRIVPVPEQTLRLLREYFSVYHPKEYLFNGQNSLQYDVRSIQQVFHRAKKEAGIKKKVSVHSLRHSRATELKRNGVDLTYIQRLLGHSNIKTTQDFYDHTDVSDLQREMMKADMFLIGNMKMIAA